MCGGTAEGGLILAGAQGLSPRVRGNHRHHERPLHHRGSIPACAGEPHDALILLNYSTVYPRVCGGTPPGKESPVWQKGLSPRVRGNPTATTVHLDTARSIPACAGEPELPK